MRRKASAWAAESSKVWARLPHAIQVGAIILAVVLVLSGVGALLKDNTYGNPGAHMAGVAMECVRGAGAAANQEPPTTESTARAAALLAVAGRIASTEALSRRAGTNVAHLVARVKEQQTAVRAREVARTAAMGRQGPTASASWAAEVTGST